MLRAGYLVLCAAVATVPAILPARWGLAYAGLSIALWAVTLAIERTAPRSAGLVVTAAAALTLLLAAPPYTSNDVWRYLWDGHAVLQGWDPYSTSPESLQGLYPDWPAVTDNRTHASIYPPAAQAVFAAVAALGPDSALAGWKILVALAALATLTLAARLIGARSGAGLALLSPLFILECGIGAHVDVFCALSVLGALAFARTGRWKLAGAAMGTGILFKLYPLALLPALAGAAPSRRLRLNLTAGAVAIVAGGYGAVRLMGWEAFGSLGVFAREWHFGSPAFALLRLLLADASARGVLAFFIAATLGASFRVARSRGPERGACLALAGIFLASPVCFPWYLMPVALLVPWNPAPALVAWLALVPLTYEAIDGQRAGLGWAPASWPLVVIALGAALTLLTTGTRILSWSDRTPPEGLPP